MGKNSRFWQNIFLCCCHGNWMTCSAINVSFKCCVVCEIFAPRGLVRPGSEPQDGILSWCQGLSSKGGGISCCTILAQESQIDAVLYKPSAATKRLARLATTVGAERSDTNGCRVCGSEAGVMNPFVVAKQSRTVVREDSLVLREVYRCTVGRSLSYICKVGAPRETIDKPARDTVPNSTVCVEFLFNSFKKR